MSSNIFLYLIMLVQHKKKLFLIMLRNDYFCCKLRNFGWITSKNFSLKCFYVVWLLKKNQWVEDSFMIQ